MKKCQKCGVENQENAKFCMKCGYCLDSNNTEVTTDTNESVPNSLISKRAILKHFRLLVGSKRKLLMFTLIPIIIVIIGSSFYLIYNDDFNKLKRYFEENDTVSLSSLKETISPEDWEQFEVFLSEEAERVLDSFNNNTIESDEAKAQIEKIEEFSSKNNSKRMLSKEFENLNNSKKAFSSGLEYREANEPLKAYENFKSVISTDTDYEQAQTYIKELKPKVVEALIEKAMEEHEAGKHSQSLKTINTAIEIDSENTELKTLKAQFEEAKLEADKKAKEEAKRKAEEAKRKAEEAEAAKILTNGKIIETANAEIKFVDAKFSTKILPDDISGVYLYYTAESDEIFLDLKFKIKNIGKYGLGLYGLLSNVITKYGDGYTYQTYNCFWTESPGNISNVYSWNELDPLKTTTFHLAVKLPREVADSKESLRVTFKIAGQEQILEFR